MLGRSSSSATGDFGLYTVHHTLAVNARRYSAQAAIIQNGVILTYAELNARANQIAHELVARGVKQNDRVAIFAGNTLSHVVAIYAIAKAGATSVVFDVKWVARETTQVADQFDCSLLIADRAHAAQLAPDTIKGFRLGVIWTDARDPGRCDFELAYRLRSESELDIMTSDDSIFMLMLTSGTTGRPKGCIKSHKSYLHSCIINVIGKRMGGGLKELLVVPIYYNSGRSSLITQLSFGGTVHLKDAFDATDVLATVDREKIECLALAPQQCEELLNHPDLARYDKSSLRVLRKAGLPFKKRSLQNIMDHITPHVFQAYGGTEFSEATVLTPENQLAKIGSAGLPLWGMEVGAVGADGKALPAGVEGNICVRGPSVCDGYYNDQQATASAFVDGWYRSGDLGYFDEDGFLYISGREKNIIKTGGINVAPAEIEDILLSFEEVADAAIIGVPDEKWGTAIKALVQLRPGARIAEEELIRRCGESLSRYKLPKIVAYVDEINRNALGKIAKTEHERDG